MDAFAVKTEPVEVSLQRRCTEEDEDVAASRKKRRLTVTVVVPTMREVNQRAAGVDVKQDVQGSQGADSKVKLDKVLKVKKNPREFDLDTINRRLDALGANRDYEVNVPDHIKSTAVPRRFLSDMWGGGTQRTFPTIRKEMLAKHGLDDWMYPNSEYNPHCPLVPGFPGLMFAPDGLHGPGVDPEEPDIWRTIVRLPNEARWLYVGQYIGVGAKSLTKEEWLIQQPKVRNTWAREVWRKGWGWDVRVRVTLRKQLGRNPTKRELKAAFEDTDNLYHEITPEDVRAAYDCGEELLGVRLLKCVGYDEAFQREIHEKIQDWVQPPPPEKNGKKGKTGFKRHKAADPRALKRKQPEEDVTDSDGCEIPEMDDGEEEAEDLVYVPKGTKSRPKELLLI